MMPIVDLQPIGLTERIGPASDKIVTPGKADVDYGSDVPEPSWMDSIGAAFRHDNTIGSFLTSADGVPIDKEEGFNAWDSIKGTKYEPYWKSFGDVRNSRAADIRKRQIDQEDEDRKILDASPWYQGAAARLLAGVADVPTLIPGGAFVRGAKGGFSMIRSGGQLAAMAGVSAAAQESALQATQETRTAGETAFTIGASVFLGGLLGAGGAKLLSNAEWSSAVRALDDEIAGARPVSGIPMAAGAAAVRPATLEENTIAGTAARKVAESTSWLNTALGILNSPSPVVREIGLKMFENSTYLNKNMQGVATEASAETLMKEWRAGLGRAVGQTGDMFLEYKKAGGALNPLEFRQAVGKAMRRADEDADPFVTKTAKMWRAEVFDPLKDAAIKAKLLPEDVTVDTAASYFSRMWNRNRLLGNEGAFKGIVERWVRESTPRWAQEFDIETAAKAAKLKGDELKEFEVARRIERQDRFEGSDAARQIADDVFDRLTGKAEGGVRQEFITVTARGPLKERTFNIPDHLVEDFLEHDVDLVGRRYSRVMSADVELANKFGRPDLKDQIEAIRADFKRLRDGVTDQKELARLNDAEAQALGGRRWHGRNATGDITDLRDLLRGTRQEAANEGTYASIVRAAGHFNYMRSMGEVVLASITDAVRPAMVHGLVPFMETSSRLATGLHGIKMSVQEAKQAGNIAENILAHRMATLTDLNDPYATRGPVEAFLENMTNVASKWNGIRWWTDQMKSIASVMTQDRILGNVEKFATAKAKDKAYLAYLGIDESMAGRIAKQYAEFGEVVQGTRVANTAQWTDPQAVRAYRAGMNKDVDSIIIERSVADLHSFAHTPTGKALLQFKSFALASHQKVLLRGLQEDQSRFIGGLVGMTAAGMAITYFKALSGNRPELQEKMIANPGWWIGEGLDRSGIFSVPMEIANAVEKGVGYNLLKSPLKAFDEANQISQKNQNRSQVGSLLGPTAGLADDILTASSIPKTMIEGEEISKGQRAAAERLFPFSSYIGIRQLLRYGIAPDQ